ncbi:MAG: hypothetical protein ABWY29_01215 [Blastococcus sp.]
MTTPTPFYGSQIVLDGVVVAPDGRGRLVELPDEAVVTRENLSEIITQREKTGDVSTQGATGQSIPARYSRSFSDYNGILTLQNNNELNPSVAWGYRLSPASRTLIASLVYEEGLYFETSRWYTGQNSPHTVSDDYVFHGTMKPTYTYDRVEYIDYFHFTAANGARGELTIWGYFYLSRGIGG